jgi:RNA polymerase sigma-70 factor (sigma-E family)
MSRGRTRTAPAEAADERGARLWYMESNPRGSAAAFVAAGHAGPGGYGAVSAEDAVTGLYEANALGLIRLAYIMLGDRPSAEDVVQEAFCGLYRRWPHLAEPASAVHYVRSSVLNGCRSVLRRSNSLRSLAAAGYQPPESSAESVALIGEERREVMRALGQLPQRQREALVLRFYLDLSADEAAAAMGISPSSVRSAITRGLASLGRLLQESS